MDEMELTQGQKEQLIERLKELLDENVLKMPDWCAMYDIMIGACDRAAALSMENYLMVCLEGKDPE